MRITKLSIKNFKSLIDFSIENLPDMVVLAGPNGVGKSSVLQAIVHLKETVGPYGGYRIPNIVSSNAEFAEVSAIFKLTDREFDYLTKVVNIPNPPRDAQCDIRINKQGEIVQRNVSAGLSQILQLYDRENYPQIGVIDYIDPHRLFRPKDITSLQVSGLSLSGEKQRRIALGENKFDQLKEFLAQIKLRDLQELQDFVRSHPSGPISSIPDSLEPVKRLFTSLLAPKEFYDVDLSRSPVKYVVKTPGGAVDIDNLSSGEKEILFVFTELMKLKLNDSIILFDEPDLHLHEEIQRRIPNALKQLGDGNQLWITTHSLGIMSQANYDELIRVENYSGNNQAVRVFDDAGKMASFRDVAGEIGIVTFGERIVFLEGTTSTDKFILESFFPHLKGRLAFVSAGPVADVTRVSQKILDLLKAKAGLNFYYAISDRDFMTDQVRSQIIESGQGRLFVWSRYHIENYLLDDDIIFSVTNKVLGASNPLSSPQDVQSAFIEILRENRNLIVAKMVADVLNSATRSAYVEINPLDVLNDATTKAKRLLELTSSSLSGEKVSSIVADNYQKFDRMLSNGEWRIFLPGRDLLSRFAGKYPKLEYSKFRNLIVAEMREKGRIPDEVKKAIDHIASS
jgi:hypothetical protein